MPRPALNLARRPFLNRRPVLRVAVMLAAMAGLVLLVDAVLYGRDLIDSRALGERQQEVRELLQEEQAQVEALQAQREFQGLAEYNQTIGELNALIAERTFPWGRLLDRLSEVLPPGVRLQRLSPGRDRRREIDVDAGAAAGRPVDLTIDGVAQSDEMVYGFVDALFAAPDFEEPVLDQESEGDGGRSFSLQVRFLTAAAATPGRGREGRT